MKPLPICSFAKRLRRYGLVAAAALITSSLHAQTYYITTPTVWSSNMTASDITIAPGGSLTINNGAVLTMTGMAKFRVWPNPAASGAGGRLIVNNATITTNNFLWPGISVMGNFLSGSSTPYPKISQDDPRIAKAQFTNAIIEKAQWGVCNFDLENDYNANQTGGGVIQATTTTFRNNGIAAWLQHYRNFSLYNNATTLPDRSYFNKCTFLMSGQAPSSLCFLRLHDVGGVNALGNTYTVTPAYGGKALPFSGIRLENAGVNVDEYCNSPIQQYGQPCTNTTPSVFNNLRRGIETYNATTELRTITVQHSAFNDCMDGIKIEGANSVTLIENVLNMVPDLNVNQTAIFLGGCTGYKVEGNTVNTNNPVSNSRVWGIAAKNSGGAANKIYRNRIFNTNYALQGVDYNRNTQLGTQGLQFLCNTMTNTVTDAYDISVVASSDPNAYFNGIAGYQGNFDQNGGFAVAGNNYSALTTATPHNFLNNSLSLVYVGSMPAGGNSSSVNLVGGANFGCGPTYGGPFAVYMNPAVFVAQKQKLEVAINSNPGKNDAYLIQYVELHNQMAAQYAGAVDSQTQVDSLIWVLDGARYFPDFKIREAGVLAADGQWADAQNVLSAIPTSYTLSKAEQKDIFDLTKLYSIGDQLQASGWDWDGLSNTDKAVVQDIADNGSGNSRFAARYFLAAGEDAAFDAEVVRIAGRTGEVRERLLADAETTEALRLFPNPTANGLVTVAGLTADASYSVCDATGRMLHTGTLTPSQNTLDLRVLPSGLYVVQLRSGNGAAVTYKVTRQ